MRGTTAFALVSVKVSLNIRIVRIALFVVNTPHPTRCKLGYHNNYSIQFKVECVHYTQGVYVAMAKSCFRQTIHSVSVRCKIPISGAGIEWWCHRFFCKVYMYTSTYLNWYQSIFISLEQCCLLQPQFRYSVATHMMPLRGIIVIPRHCWSHIVQWMAIVLLTNLSSFSVQCQVSWSPPILD